MRWPPDVLDEVGAKHERHLAHARLMADLYGVSIEPCEVLRMVHDARAESGPIMRFDVSEAIAVVITHAVAGDALGIGFDEWCEAVGGAVIGTMTRESAEALAAIMSRARGHGQAMQELDEPDRPQGYTIGRRLARRLR